MIVVAFQLYEEWQSFSTQTITFFFLFNISWVTKLVCTLIQIRILKSNGRALYSVVLFSSKPTYVVVYNRDFNTMKNINKSQGQNIGI